MDSFLGEVRMFGGNFAPSGWAMCQGQLLSIAQNTALFSLLGTNFGGNGTSNFGLPNLQSAAPMHQGNGPGLTPRAVGESGGEPTITLQQTQLPAHTHALQSVAGGNSNSPVGNLLGGTRTSVPYAAVAAGQPMAPASCGAAGSNQPHNNLQPYLAVTFIIALVGIFPARG